jgi:hypothetical protein
MIDSTRTRRGNPGRTSGRLNCRLLITPELDHNLVSLFSIHLCVDLRDKDLLSAHEPTVSGHPGEGGYGALPWAIDSPCFEKTHNAVRFSKLGFFNHHVL